MILFCFFKNIGVIGYVLSIRYIIFILESKYLSRDDYGIFMKYQLIKREFYISISVRIKVYL